MPWTAGVRSALTDLGVGVLGSTSMVYRMVVADAIEATSGVQLVHEASASADRSRSGVRFSRAYDAVLGDPDVDVVYIPLPNHLHEEWVLACAAAGKHVLCEKPLGIDAASTERMVRGCRDAGVVLLEAYMSPFHPRSSAVQQAAADGDIGTILHGEARMSGELPADNHRWSREAGGGALLDVGIYCLEPVLTAMGWDGAPAVGVAAASMMRGDVDETTSAWLALQSGQTLHLWVSFAAPDQQRLQLTGATGTIEVATRHATPDRRDSGYDRRRPDGGVDHVPTGTGSCYEGMIAHARDVITSGAAPLRNGTRSIAVAGIIDQIATAAGHPRTR